MVQSSRLGAHSISPATLATLGVTGSNKALSMSTLGLFGSAGPVPPPGPGVHIVNPSLMLSTIGKLL